MSGAFNAGGLITGIDSNKIIEQLIQLERQPINRMKQAIDTLEKKRTAIKDIRTTLTDLYNKAKDFSLTNVFNQFSTTSSEEDVLTATASGPNPTIGAYTIEVQRLASATIARSSSALGAPIDTTVALDSSGIATDITAGTFTINGVEFTVDPSSDSLDDILSQINSSSAGVTASYDSDTDKVTFVNNTTGDSSIINFTADGDTSNFLSVIGVSQATQSSDDNGTTQVTSTRNLGAISVGDTLEDVHFKNGSVSAGAFSINGVSISVDPTKDSLNDIITRINESDAGVSASYDTATDTIRVTSNTLGSRTINFGSDSDTSNFLSIVNLDTATQTAGQDAQFTINGGAVQTRNTNEISDAIGDVTITLKSTGTSTVTISSDDQAVLKDVRDFLDEVNSAISDINDKLKKGGVLEGDSSIQVIMDYIRNSIFSNVPDGGSYSTLLDIGISTGDTFDSKTISKFEVDEDKFLEALKENRTNVAALFTNENKTGVADMLASYLKDATATNGFLNERIKPNGIIDQQIKSQNNRIDMMERRISMHEERLRKQFARMEELAAGFQQQSAALLRLG